MLIQKNKTMEDIYKAFVKKIRTGGEKSSFLLFLFILALNVGFSLDSWGQSINTCGKATLTGLEVLKNAVPDPNTNGHINNGSWTILSGLGVDTKGTNKADDDVLSGFVDGNSYLVRWTHTSGADYDVTIIANSTPTAVGFSANGNTDVCDPGAGNTAPVSLVVGPVTGGTPNWNVVVDEDGVPKNTVTLNSPVATTTLMYNISGTTTFSVSDVTDGVGCKMDPANFPAPVTFTFIPAPTAFNISGTDVCFGTSTNVLLENSENGIEYVLRRNGVTDVATWTSTGDGVTHNYPNITQVGTYTVVALSSCGDVTMNGDVKVLNAPVVNNMTGPAGVLCQNGGYVFGMDVTELNVDYILKRDGIGVNTKPGSAGGAVSFDQMFDAGEYTVWADNGGCEVQMNGSFTIVANPSTAPIVVGADICEGVPASGTTIQLFNSEADVNYTLYRDNGGVLTPVGFKNGGGNILFGSYNIPGVYIVEGERNGCKSTMSGDVVIRALPADQPFGYTSVCLTGAITLPASEPDVQYRLLKNNIATGIAINGKADGSGFSFPVQTEKGTYTVEAIHLSGTPLCSKELSGSLTIEVPTIYDLEPVGGKTAYCKGLVPTGVSLQLSGSEIGNTYQLIRDGADYRAAQGDDSGDPLVWNDVEAGTYKVKVSTPSGCTVEMGNVTISEHDLPTATISIDANNSRCANENKDFTIHVSMTGTPPYTFTIKDDKTPANKWTITSDLADYPFNRTPAETPNTTTYTVETITDINGCTNTGVGAATINVHAVPVVTIDAPDQICVNTPTALRALPDDLTYSYLWETGHTTQTINVAPATPNVTETFKVTVTTDKNCSATATKDIFVNDLPVVSFTGIDPDGYCENHGPVVLTPNPPGGTFYLNGQPLPGNSFDPMGHLGNNTIEYSYTNLLTGCSNTTLPQTVVVHEVTQAAIINLPAEICKDSPAITIYGNVTNGQPGTGFRVVDGAGLDATINADGTITINPAGSVTGTPYTLEYTLVNGNGCVSKVQGVTKILDLNTGSLTFTPLAALYCQEDNGPYNLQGYVNGLPATSGIFSGPGVTDGGNNGTAQFVPSDAGIGIHTITFSYVNAEGCTGQVTQTTQVGTVLATNLQPAYCEGDALDIIQGNPVGGYFEIKPPTGATYTINADNFSLNPTDLAAADPGDYTISYILKDSPVPGCTTTDSWTTRITRKVDATFTGLKDNYCVTEGPSLLTAIHAQAGDIVGFKVDGNAIAQHFNPQTVGIGPHTVECNITSANGCVSSWEKETNVEALPIVNNIPGLSNEYCDTDPEITITAPNPGEDGTYKFTCASSIQGQQPLTHVAGDEFAKFDPSAGPGYYTVTFTFTPNPATGTGCEFSVVQGVRVYQNIPVDFGPLANTYCQNGDEVVLIGSYPGGTFEINEPAGKGITDNGNGTATFKPSELLPGLYLITYTYEHTYNGTGHTCTDEETKQVEIKSSPSTYTVIDANGKGGKYCLGGTGVLIRLSDSQVGVSYELLRSDKSVAIPKVDGTGNAIDFQLQTVEGKYTVLATDKTTGCQQVMDGFVNVEITDIALDVSIKDVSCREGNDGEVAVIATGGTVDYDYYWEKETSPGNWTYIDNHATVGGRKSGTFRVKVTDANGCEDSQSNIIVNQPATKLAASVTTTKVSCDCTAGTDCDGSATLNIVPGSGTPDYTWTWSTANADNKAETGLAAGNYSVTVRDSKNCELTVPFNIDTEVALDLTFDSKVDNTCHGSAKGEFIVYATGGSGEFEFSINDPTSGSAVWYPENLGDGYHLTKLTAGSYNVWVRDAGHPRCHFKLANPIVITEPDELVITEVVKPIDCNGNDDGEITITATGGSGVCDYAFEGVWVTAASGNTFHKDNLAPKDYRFQVRDNGDNSCVSSELHVTIDPVEELTLTAVVKNATCPGEPDGKVTLTATGGDGNYVYSKDGGLNWEVDNVFENLAAGNHEFRVKDGNGCDKIITETVNEPDAFSISEDLTKHEDVKCHGEKTGSFTVKPSRAGNFEYQIDGSGVWQTNPQFSGKGAGTYFVVVRDMEQTEGQICTATAKLEITITQPAAPITIDNADVTPVQCYGESNGGIMLTVSGGTPFAAPAAAYQYEWRDASNNLVDITDNPKTLSKGNYTVTISDQYCAKSEDYTISEPTDWVVGYDKTDVTVNGLTDGSIVINSIQGQYGNYTVTWDDGSTGLTRNDLAAGDYWFEVRSDGHCEKRYDVTINQPDDLVVKVEKKKDVNCHGGNDGQIDIEITSGTAPFVVELDGVQQGAELTTAPPHSIKLDKVSAGTHTIEVRDAKGDLFEKEIIVDEPVSGISVDNVQIKNITCGNTNDGQITLDLSGGKSDYKVVWSGPDGFGGFVETVPALSVLKNISFEGEYTATITDQNGCITKEKIPVVRPAVWDVKFDIHPVSVNGGNDGAINNMVVTGNNGDYNIKWDNNSTEWSRSNLIAGTYEFTITDKSGCTYTDNVIISQPGPLTVEVIKQEPFICYGDSTGSILVNIPVGNPPYDITLTGTAYDGLSITQNKSLLTTGHEFTGLKAGRYNISVTDAEGNSFEKKDIELIQPDELVITENVRDDISCSNKSDGAITVDISGGDISTSKKYKAEWNGPKAYYNPVKEVDAQSAISNLVLAGNYVVKVTDDRGCASTRTILITKPVAWDIKKDVTHISVFGRDEGRVDITDVSGNNTPPHTITWVDNNSHDNPRTNMAAGDYELIVENSTSTCDTTIHIIVSDEDALRTTIDADDVKCYGEQTGVISLSIAKGKTPYKVSWTGTQFDGIEVNDVNDNAPGFFAINNLYAGEYTVTVTGANGATITFYQIITQPEQLVMSGTITNIKCYDSVDGKIVANLSGRTINVGDGYTMTWTYPSGHQETGDAAEPTIYTQDNLALSGNYKVEVVDNVGCSISDFYHLGRPDEMEVVVDEKLPVECHGDKSGFIRVHLEGRPAGTAVRYDWMKKDTGSGNWIDYVTNSDKGALNVEAGTYRVTLTELGAVGCSAVSEEIVITEPEELNVSVTPTHITTCNGDNSGMLSVFVQGGTPKYTVNYGVGTVHTIEPVKEIQDLYAGTYNVIVTDSKGCAHANVAATILEPGVLSVENLTYSIDCETANSGEVTFDVSGATAYQVRLISNGVDYASGNPYPVGNIKIENLPEGDYELIVADNNSSDPEKCTFKEEFKLEHVTIKPVVIPATCEGLTDGSIAITVEGGSGNYIAHWTTNDGGLGLVPGNLSQMQLSKGEYVLVYEDVDRKCTLAPVTYQVSNEHTLQIEGNPQAVNCNGESNGLISNVEVKDGSHPDITYTWSGPDVDNVINTPVDPSINDLVGGQYTLAVEDGNGCKAQRDFMVVKPDAISFDLIAPPVVCDPYSRSIQVNNIQGGTGNLTNYTVTVTGPGNENLVVSDLSTYVAGTPLTILNGLTQGGLYTVTITDEKHCSVDKSIELNHIISISEDINHLECNGNNNGAILLKVTGGSGDYEYNWTTTDGTGQDNVNGASQVGLTAGTYKVEVTDKIETCKYSKNITVTQPVGIVIDGTSTDLTCAGNNNGAINLNVTGGTGNYTYEWSTTDGSGIDINDKNQTNLSAGTYSVTVTDGNKCKKTKEFTITTPLPLTFDLAVTDTDCDDNNQIEIQNTGGGSGDYEFVWAGAGIDDSHQNKLLVDNLPGGEYTVKMVDVGTHVGDKCTLIKTVTLTKPLQIKPVVTPQKCAGIQNGAIALEIIGGKAPFDFTWTTAVSESGLDEKSQNQGGLKAGKYNLHVEDARGCHLDVNDIEVGMTHTISVWPTIQDVKCLGDNTGAIDITVAGGSGPANYEYDWSGPNSYTADTKDIKDILAGNYLLTLTDKVTSCEVSVGLEVKEPQDKITITVANKVDVKCKGAATGEIDIDVTGGTGSYTYFWEGPGNLKNGVQDQTELIAGDYYVTVKDENDCYSKKHGPITILEPEKELVISLKSKSDVTTAGGSDGVIEVEYSGGTGNVTYTWEKIDEDGTVLASIAGNESRKDNLQAGYYRVTATDQTGCTSVLDKVVIWQPDQDLTIITLNKKDVRPCNGNNNGEIHVQVKGGTPYMTTGTAQYTIKWFVGGIEDTEAKVEGTLFSKAGLSAGEYKITATDNAGLTKELPISIIEHPVLEVTAEVTESVTCYEGADGVISVNVTGGKPRADGRYQVTLTGSDVTKTEEITADVDFINLPKGTDGTYTITVVDDANGDDKFSTVAGDEGDCEATTVISISQPEAHVVLSALPGNETLCEGTKPQLQLMVDNWPLSAAPLWVTLNDGTEVLVNKSPMEVSPTDMPGVGISKYEIISVVLEADKSCAKGFGTGEVEVTVHPLPRATVSGSSQICVGEEAEIAVDLSGTGPWDIWIQDDFHHTEKVTSENGRLMHKVTPGTTTSYSVLKVSDEHCENSGEGEATITVKERAAVEISGDADICEGASTNLTFTFNKGDTPWTVTYEEVVVDDKGEEVKTPRTLGPITENSFDLSVTPAVTTVYRLVSVTDDNGCDQEVTGEARVTIRQKPDMPGEITRTDDPDPDMLDIICQGATATYSIPEIVHADRYIWELPNGATIVPGTDKGNEITVQYATDAKSGYLSVKGQNGCGEGPVRSLRIYVDALPGSIGNIIGPDKICQGATSVTYSIDNPTAANYRWSYPPEFIPQGVDNASVITFNLDPMLDALDATITAIPKNQCGEGTSGATKDVTVTPLPVAYAGHDQDVCGTETTLEATMPGGSNLTGEWIVVSGSATVVSPKNPTSEITNLSRGDVVLNWIIKNTVTDCEATDEVTIRNNQLAVSATADATMVCEGTATIHGTPLPKNGYEVEGHWEVVEPAGWPVVFEDNTKPTTKVANLAPGRNVLRWVITQNKSCSSSGDIEIINNQPSEALIDGEEIIELCDNKVTLSANDPVQGEGKWTFVQGGGTIDNDANHNISVTDLSQGDNLLRWTITKGSCSRHDVVTLRNNKRDVDAGADLTICDDFTTLEGTAVPEGFTGQWNIVGDASGVAKIIDGDSPKTEVNNLIKGENKFKWVVQRNGCINDADVTITCNKALVASVESNKNVCGTATTLKAGSITYGSGQWSVIQGSGRFESVGSNETKVTGLDLGENIFRWNTFSDEGCSDYSDVTVTNLQVPVFAGKDTAVCDRLMHLNGNVPAEGNGRWTVVSGKIEILPDEAVKPDAFVKLDHGSNSLAWTITNNGCTSSDVVNIEMNGPNPAMVDAGLSTTINDGSSQTHLGATKDSRGIGKWEILSGGGNIIDPTDPKTLVTDLRKGPNTFLWTVTIGTCSLSDEVTITNGEVTKANAGLDQVVCASETEMHANYPEVGIGEWSLVKGEGKFVNKYKHDTRVYDLGTEGDNVFRWTIKFGDESATSHDDVTIINNSPDLANAGAEKVEICADSYTLKGNPPTNGMGVPFWKLLSGSGVFNNPDIPEPTVSGLSKGENVLVYSITKGDANKTCVSTDTIRVINGLPSDAFAGNNVVTCKDSILLNPNSPSHGVGEWKVIEGHAVIDGNWAKELGPGDNKLTWVISTEYCSDSQEITVTSHKPSTSYAGTNRDICTDKVQLSANDPEYGTGKWELVSGSGEIAEEGFHESMVTNLGKGSNRFRWIIDNNGCTSSSEVEISNNLIEAQAGFDQVLCVDTVRLQANNALPGIGTWGVKGGSGSARFDEPNNPYSVVRDLDQGKNVLTWTILNKGCTHVSEVNVTNNQPTEALAGDKQALCETNSTVLAANRIGNNETGTWTILSGAADFVDIHNPDTNIDNLAFGRNIFRWTIRKEDCVSSSDVEIDYNRIEARVGADEAICSADHIMEANNAAPGIGNWSIVGGTSQAVFENQNNPKTPVYNLAQGKNVLRWTISYNNCTTSADMTITNNLPDAAYAGSDQENCQSSTTLDAKSVEIGKVRWEVLMGSGTIVSSTNPKTEVTGLSKGDNVFNWVVENEGCVLDDVVRITNNQPSAPYAGRDVEICRPEITLKATPPEVGSGLWTIVKGGGNFDDPSRSNAKIQNMNPGENILEWTLTQGQCKEQDRITVINNTATVANAGPDIEDCKDWSILDANTATFGDGAWSMVSGKGDFDNVVKPKTTIRNLGFGKNVLLWTIQNGACFSTDSVIVFNQVPDKSYAGSDREVCEDYLVLNANNPVSGHGKWTVVSGAGTFEDATMYNSKVTDINFGENVYKWIISYGECTTEDVVTVRSNKTVPYAGENDVTYEPEYELQGANPGKQEGTWTVIAGNGEFEDASFFNTKVTKLNAGKNTFRWTMDVNGCVAYSDVTINYKEVPDAGFTIDVDKGCYPLRVKFTNYSVGGTSFHWDFGDGDSSGDRHLVHTYDEPGEYVVSLTAPGPDGKDDVFTKTITVYDHPVADFDVTPTLVYVPGEKIRCYDLSRDADKYLWEFGDGNTSEEPNPSYEYQEAGQYSMILTVHNEYGCEDVLHKENLITVKMAGFIAFPNAFAPRPESNDLAGQAEVNTIFKPVYRDVDEYHLQIYNRWGQLIYESNDVNEGWNGFYMDKLAPRAVYVWKASGRFISGKEFRETGSVLLIR
ncbi:PKD domain-containing protein [Marinilabiliaceae bacterium JC017]|nr:PKD domain-containing protein [Marinilabiliaceae bacterium JC017]